MLKFFLLLRLYTYPLFEYFSYQSSLFNKFCLPLYWRFFWAVERKLEALEFGEKGTSLYQTERAVLIEEILSRKLNPTVLEVGTGFGQNIAILTEVLPQKNLFGMDLKQSRIDETALFFSENNLFEITLTQGDARSLTYENSSFDVVFTSAVMLYSSYEDCKKILSEMLRVSSSRVVLLEQQREGERDQKLSGGVTGDEYYVRDYELLIKDVLHIENIVASYKKIKIQNPRWQVESWKDMAYVFVIDKKKSSSI